MSCQNLSVAGGFYEIGAYKTNIRRIKDGIDELDELSKMIKERSDIEAKYGKALQQWHEKWINHVHNKTPNGLIKDSWSNILDEGQELSKVHVAVKERFHDEIIKTIGLFKKDNHHSRPFGGNSKEIHEISEAFEKAQKQWKKLYEKLESSKKLYHSACRNEKSAAVNYSNSQADTSVSLDANEKLRERLEKCKDEVRKCKKNYENNIMEIDKYKHVYIENMGFVFEKCQQMELKRMKFTMEMINAIQKILNDIVDAHKLQSIHNHLKEKFTTINDEEYQKDLKEWSKIHGVDAPMHWPMFELYPQSFLLHLPLTCELITEYTPEMRQITHKQAKDSGGIVLTKKIVTSDELPGTPVVMHKSIESSSSTASSRPISTNSSLGTNDYHQQQQTRNELHREPSYGSSSQENENITDKYSTTKSSTIQEPSKILKSSNRSSKINSPFADPFPMRTPESKNIVSSTSVSINDTPKKSASPDSSITAEHTYDKCVDSNGNECDDEIKYGDFPGQIRGPAKALYDYIPIEDDEIPLKKGELLEVISGPDHLGWCMGRKGNESGLFPASYVAAV